MFILILSLILPLPLPSEENSLIAVVAILGLFIGFVFQGFSRLSRKRLLYRDQIFQDIKCKDRDTFNKAKRILINKKLVNTKYTDEDTIKNLKDYFYKMDNYLRGKMQSVIIDHFSAKAAFWSNIFWALLFLAVISVVKIITYILLYQSLEPSSIIIAISAVIMVPLSYSVSKEYWSSQYDVVMKTFIMVVALDLKIKIN